MSKHFPNEDLQCPCCKNLLLHGGFIEQLEELRVEYGKPMIVNSCYRCEKHNAAVGGSPNSYHKRGMAIDVHCPDARDRHRLGLLAMKRGWSVIVYKTFLHLDRRIDAGKEPILTVT